MGFLDEHVYKELYGKSEKERKDGARFNYLISMQSNDDSLPVTIEIFIAPYELYIWQAKLAQRRELQNKFWDAQKEWNRANPIPESEDPYEYISRMFESLSQQDKALGNIYEGMTKDILSAKAKVYKESAGLLKGFILEMRARTMLQMFNSSYSRYFAMKNSVDLGREIEDAARECLAKADSSTNDISRLLGTLEACEIIKNNSSIFYANVVEPIRHKGHEFKLDFDTFIGRVGPINTNNEKSFERTFELQSNIQRSASELTFAVHGMIKGEYSVLMSPMVVLNSMADLAGSDVVNISPVAIRVMMPSSKEKYAIKFFENVAEHYKNQVVPKALLQRAE